MDDVATIIKEYSMPLTRGDWRRLHKYTNDRFQEDLVVLNYNLYLQIHKNKRNGGYLLKHKFKYLYEKKELLYFNGLYYSVVELNELVVVIQRGNKKIYCLYNTDSLEIDGYLYQDVDQIIYILSVFYERHYIAEKILFIFCFAYLFTFLI
jgi:hypothetical protein